MSFLNTTLKNGWITDLVLPAPTGVQTPQSVIAAGQSTAFEMANDPIFMCKLNPLVQNVVELDPSDPKCVNYVAMAKSFDVDLNAEYATEGWRQYAITDKLNPFPGYTTDLTYHSAIRRTKDGMEALTNAGSGVTIYGRFSIKVAEPRDVLALDASDGKGWVVNYLETNVLKCNTLLSYYVKATTDKSHRAAHGRFKELWRERMKGKGFICQA